jgi:hypothetical protein
MTTTELVEHLVTYDEATSGPVTGEVPDRAAITPAGSLLAASCRHPACSSPPVQRSGRRFPGANAARPKLPAADDVLAKANLPMALANSTCAQKVSPEAKDPNHWGHWDDTRTSRVHGDRRGSRDRLEAVLT